MPASGNIVLKTCTATCNSISCAVTGNAIGQKSLNDLGCKAGMTAPFTTACFYNYDNFVVTPTSHISIPNSLTTESSFVCAPSANTYTLSCSDSWIVACSPVTPSPTGTLHCFYVCCNTGAARQGTICYIPSFGATASITLCQLAASVTTKAISIYNISDRGNGTSNWVCATGCLNSNLAMVAGECYYPAFCWTLIKPLTGMAAVSYVCITCNGTCIYGCCIGTRTAYNCAGTFAARCVAYGNCLNIYTSACISALDTAKASATVYISTLTNCVGCFCIQSGSESQVSYTCGT